MPYKWDEFWRVNIILMEVTYLLKICITCPTMINCTTKLYYASRVPTVLLLESSRSVIFFLSNFFCLKAIIGISFVVVHVEGMRLCL
jgi:hypothetical protein